MKKEVIDIDIIKKRLKMETFTTALIVDEKRILLNYIKKLEKQNKKNFNIIDKIYDYVEELRDYYDINDDMWWNINNILEYIKELKEKV